ncbi:hypothetical protein M404DRAFT_1007351, partial [Pisolithus tinctorius Marx 270]
MAAANRFSVSQLFTSSPILHNRMTHELVWLAPSQKLNFLLAVPYAYMMAACHNPNFVLASLGNDNACPVMMVASECLLPVVSSELVCETY